MKQLIMAGLTIATLTLSLMRSTAAEPAGPPCSDGTCPGSRWSFRIEEGSEKCVVPGWVRNPPVVKQRTVAYEVPCTRTVPVCIKDPVTGDTRTEYKEETYLKRVSTVVVDVIQPDVTYSRQPVPQTYKRVKVYMSQVPTAGCDHP